MDIVSNCCSAAPLYGDTMYGLCGDCKEHCEFIELGDDDITNTIA